MHRMAWTEADLPDLTGRRVIVTGANSGLGAQTSRALAQHGASVTMAVRTMPKGEATAARIRELSPDVDLTVMALDLADLASVRAFADEWSQANPEGLDLLINNAGVMAIPRRETADGFEMQFGTNHLGHFALTGHLLPALVASPRSRVVTVSSMAHRAARIDFDDLQGRRSYRRWRAYANSKLANLLFTSELQRRFAHAELSSKAVAAHPGFAATDLVFDRVPAMHGKSISERIMEIGSRTFAQSAQAGALPTLFAATAPGLPGNSYVGPDGAFERAGNPVIVGRSDSAQDAELASRLWSASEELTGVIYPFD